jgi:hypothetical protein
VATPFERRSYGQELALCQRYFFSRYAQGNSITGYWQGSSFWISWTHFPVKMRAAPTLLNPTQYGGWVFPGVSNYSAIGNHTFDLSGTSADGAGFACYRLSGNLSPDPGRTYSFEQETTLQLSAEL